MSIDLESESLGIGGGGSHDRTSLHRISLINRESTGKSFEMPPFVVASPAQYARKINILGINSLLDITGNSQWGSAIDNPQNSEFTGSNPGLDYNENHPSSTLRSRARNRLYLLLFARRIPVISG